MNRQDSRSHTADLYEIAVRAVDGSASAEAVTPCPVCSAETATRRFELEDFEEPVVICTECGLGRFCPMPSAERLRALYPGEYYGEPGVKFKKLVERFVRITGERHLSFLSRGLKPGARILDVGCGRGVVLGALAEFGFEVHGQEISAEAVRGADPRAEIRIAASLAEAEYDEKSFDQIIIWHVLEHLSDPARTLREAHRLLRPGGRLIVAVPNLSSLQARWAGADWFHLDLPRHLYHFPLEALRRLMVESGFQIGPTHHFSLRQNPFGWIQSGLNRFASSPRNGLYAMLHCRPLDAPPPYDRRTRAWFWFALIVATPFALAATLLETALRSGATIHVVANRPD
jgi:2-polyprenyl-3-methyl-5-hydroxy-6-metoxy-1,4-benzoquinol methylase